VLPIEGVTLPSLDYEILFLHNYGATMLRSSGLYWDLLMTTGGIVLIPFWFW
jgi:hypothetical protein